MRKYKGNIAFLLLILFGCLSIKGQTIFFDDFGNSPFPDAANNYGRSTSPHMPIGSFAFGVPYPSSSDYSEYEIDNDHYAVVAPGYIKLGVDSNQFYFWTPAYNEPGMVKDRSDTEKGRVMAINGGNTLASFYNRNTQINLDSYYKVSLWMYLLNGPARIAIDIKDVQTGTILGTVTSRIFYGESWDPNGNTKGIWTEVSLYFASPTSTSGCFKNNVNVSIRNDYSQSQGNDYYIDDVKLEKIDDIPSNVIPPVINCPVTDIAVSCVKPGNFSSIGEPTKFGITNQSKLPDWPENIPNGFIVLESKEKGFVITRVNHVNSLPAVTDSIKDPKEGMIVYDIQDRCIKLFNGSSWNCIQKRCND